MSGEAPAALVIALSFGTWADAVQRELAFSIDRLVAGVASDPRVGRVLVADPWRSAPRTAIRFLQGRRRPLLPIHDHPTRLLSPLRLRRVDPIDIAGIERSYRAYDRRMRRAARRLGLDQPTVLTAHPLVAGFAPLEWASRVTYYAFDDWSHLPELEPWSAVIDAAYVRIRRRGHRVASVSQAILDRIGPTGRSVLVPNGLEPDEWQPPWAEPEAAVDAPRPLILYIGSIGQRLDLHALDAVARQLEDGAIMLVGPVGDPPVIDQLARIPHVEVRGNLNRRDIAGLVHAADVCIMPHRHTPLTEAMSPLKVYEYLAGGRPVVATDLPPLRDIDPRIQLVPAGDSPAFAEAVARALDLGPASELERARFVAKNSWAQRRGQILDLAFGPDAADG